MDVELELFRSSSGSSAPWQPNQCYELYIKSPYSNPLEYESFTELTPSVCSPITTGFQVSCNIKQGSTTTLQFLFPSIETATSNSQSIRFTFSNFKTPFSAQILSSILVRSYSDSQCKNDMSYVSVASVTTQPAFLPSNAIEVSSSSNVLGDTAQSNILTVSFTPQTQMAPGGSGKIEIGMPDWYVVGSTNELMYNPESLNECTSTCMTITSSILQVGYMNIRYENMPASCIKGTKIEIKCTSFYNPIWQDKWYGFFVNLYDNEQPIYKPIEKSDSTPFLDATAYLPSPIPIDKFWVTPSDPTVNTVSEWTMYLEPSVPMQVECYIKLYMPRDFTFNLDSIESSGIFLPKNRQAVLSTNDVTSYPGTELDSRESIVFQGCFEEQSLGLQPSGRIFVRSIGTQRAVKDSDEFSLEIYKDEFLTQLIAKLNRGDKLLATDLTAGWLDNVACYPLIPQVQLSTLLYFNFTSSHNLYQGAKVRIQVPPGLQLPTIGRQLAVIGLPSLSSGSQISTQATTAVVMADNTLEILDFVLNKDRPAPYQFWFAVEGIANQISAKDAGGFTITTYYRAISDDKYYVVDTQSATNSFVATPGLLDASGEIIIDNPRCYADNAEYSIVYKSPSSIPQFGYIKIEFPSDLVFVTALTLSSGTCVTNECTWIESPPTIIIKTITTIKKEQKITLQIGGIKNPRTFKPTGSFVITSYDTDGLSLIDVGFRKNTAMTIAGEITEFSVARQNTMNGVKNDYIFTVKTDIPIHTGDILVFYYPPQITVNAQGSTSQCVSTESIVCGLSGNEVQIEIVSIQDEFGFQWTVTNLGNPASVAPSDGFTKIQIISKEGWIIAEVKAPSTAALTNTEPAPLLTFSLTQESLIAGEDTSYRIQFTPVNPLPSTGAIKLSYPPQIEPSNGTSTYCFVTTNQLWDSECTIDTVNNVIDITNVFSWSQSYSTQITILLVNMTNPIDNRPSIGFNLSTYSDTKMLYIADTVVNVMEPQLECVYPCGSCPTNDRSNCTSCFQHPFLSNPKYLMSHTDGKKGLCQSACDFGFTSNGAIDHKCVKCDPSCTGCNDNSLPNDKLQCGTCSVVAPFRLNATQLCLSQCSQGIFMMAEQTCGTCDLPCQSCFGARTNCTSCISNSTLPNLHEGTCIATCPAGTTSVAGVCEPCASPCKTCTGQPTVCGSCDLTEGRNLLFSEKCYSVCPSGYVTNFDTLQCMGCLTGCDLCQLRNTSICEYCGPNLALYETSCRGNCPANMQARDRVCVTPSTEDDLLLMYFPFLIAALILITIVLFGKLKKKALLIDGKMVMVSLQNTVPAINAFVAPLQTLATISQCILSIYYGYYIHFALALAIYIAQLVFNIAYLYWFVKHFYSKYIPEIGSKVTYKNRQIVVTEENAFDLQQETDPEFSQFVNKHRASSFLLFALMGGCHFQTAKMFYSHYFMFDMFKARWTRATFLRLSMTKWQLAYLCIVDLTLIGISIFGLATITWNNQLWIIMLESIILALLLITLGVIEKYQILDIFRYTEQPKSYKQAEAMDGYKKKLQMKMLVKVSQSKHSFRDRKLEDLLTIFGQRRCKSFFEVRQDFEKQEDERAVYTWPISPGEEVEMMKVNIKFSAADAYEQWNNVYCEGVTKPKKKDMNIQAGEPGRHEFQRALNRKQNEMLSTSQLDQTHDEFFKIRTARRRGRKNKYYNQIDQEDGDDVGEASEQETYLRLIQQQEEEEELLKNIINESTIQAKQAAVAKKVTKHAEKARIREEEAAKQLKIQQFKEAEEQRIFQESENRRLLKEEIERRKLQDELDREQAERDAIEAEEMRLAIEASFLQRQMYEKLEFERIKAAEIEKQRQEDEAEAMRLAQILAAKIAKEEALAKIERERQEADAKKQLEVRLLQQQQEFVRQQEREAKRIQEEIIKAERHAREEAEREEIRFAQEQAEEEARVVKEMERARQLQIKQAERAQRELEKQEKAEQDRLAKQLRHQQEEILRQGQHDQKLVDKAARDEADRNEKHNIREAAKVYARNLANQVSQQPINYDLPSPQLSSQMPSPKASPKQSKKKSPKQKSPPKQSSPKQAKQPKQQSPREASKPSPKPQLNQQFSMKDLPPNSGSVTVLKQALPPQQQQMSATQLNTINNDYPHRNRTQIEGIPQLKKMRSITMSEDLDMNSTLIAMNQDAMKNFTNQKESLIMCPPNASLRMFNEHDVLGDVDRDDKANVVVLEDKNGRKHDKKRNPTNLRGYLVDPKTGDVIENMTGQPMFPSNELDEKGELPAPYCIEKFNFNPHWIMGDFDYTNGKPTVLQTSQGSFVDKRGRRVNQIGWYINPGQPHLIDKDQRKKFDKRQLVGAKFDDLPKLFNYSGKRFDIRDVMGEFDKDQHGNIQLHYTNNGSQLMDALGRLCNEKGYLTDGHGNVIDKNGRQLWKSTDLKSGEFIKIFPFLKFNISKVQGDISLSQNGNPILEKQPNASYLDRKGRLVNVRGYLVDRFGNVIDIHGKVMFEKVVLDTDGEIPSVFRSGLLRQDTASSISRLMSEIERNHGNDNSDFAATVHVNDSAYDRLKKEVDGDTSVDSKMEDTPANYNIANQRYEHDSDGYRQNKRGDKREALIPESTLDEFAQSDFTDNDNDANPVLLPKNKKKNPKKNKKIKPKVSTIEFLEPTSREKNMAGAYGGEAKPELRRPRIKYDKDRLATSKKFRIATADEPRVRAQLTKLQHSTSNAAPPESKKQGFVGRESAGSKQPFSKARKSTIHIQEPDFEQVYGKDIDQFLEDSEWDIDQFNLDKSQSSDDVQVKVTTDLKLQAMEKHYLNSNTTISPRPAAIQDKHLRSVSKLSRVSNNSPTLKRISPPKQRPVVGPPRETIMSVTDDPGVIHRGEILEFDTKKR